MYGCSSQSLFRIAISTTGLRVRMILLACRYNLIVLSLSMVTMVAMAFSAVQGSMRHSKTIDTCHTPGINSGKPIDRANRPIFQCQLGDANVCPPTVGSGRRYRHHDGRDSGGFKVWADAPREARILGRAYRKFDVRRSRHMHNENHTLSIGWYVQTQT